MQTVTVQGVSIPAIGLGTFRLNGDVCRETVGRALELGYRHVDTAQMYANEAEVGEAIEASPVARDQIWLTTKIWPDNFRAADLEAAAEESVRRLRTEPDLLLLHWPNPDIPRAETIGALNQVKRRGLTRHIGISNSPVALIHQSVELSEEPLIVNQVEYHPFLKQDKVLAALRGHDMALTAYSPIAQGRVFSDATLIRIGEAHGKNAGQVTLRWLIQQDRVTAIPRSSKAANLAANLAVFDFTLSDAEMAEISALAFPQGRLIDPAMGPKWDVG